MRQHTEVAKRAPSGVTGLRPTQRGGHKTRGRHARVRMPPTPVARAPRRSLQPGSRLAWSSITTVGLSACKAASPSEPRSRWTIRVASVEIGARSWTYHPPPSSSDCFRSSSHPALPSPIAAEGVVVRGALRLCLATLMGDRKGTDGKAQATRGGPREVQPYHGSPIPPCYP